jgi:hypothetical protein
MLQKDPQQELNNCIDPMQQECFATVFQKVARPNPTAIELGISSTRS